MFSPVGILRKRRRLIWGLQKQEEQVSRRANEQSATGPYRSQSVRTGAALTARLFGASTSVMPKRNADDQSCVRAAIRRRRRTLGLTQTAAAHILGLKRLTYHRIEHGPRRIRLAELGAI